MKWWIKIKFLTVWPLTTIIRVISGMIIESLAIKNIIEGCIT